MSKFHPIAQVKVRAQKVDARFPIVIAVILTGVAAAITTSTVIGLNSLV